MNCLKCNKELEMKKRKLTLEDIDYSIHSWMYLVFIMFFFIMYCLKEIDYWLYAIIPPSVFYILSSVKENNRLKKLREKRK